VKFVLKFVYIREFEKIRVHIRANSRDVKFYKFQKPFFKFLENNFYSILYPKYKIKIFVLILPWQKSHESLKFQKLFTINHQYSNILQTTTRPPPEGPAKRKDGGGMTSQPSARPHVRMFLSVLSD